MARAQTPNASKKPSAARATPAPAPSDSLARYREKRNFGQTPEPQSGGEANPEARAFVIQKHWASRLHYDFRLELDGSMKSWAVPKGPSLDPHDKRMAVQVEDHPIAYNRFEGEIPPNQYGAGKVIIWDKGVWTPLGDPAAGYRDGHLKFELQGHKLAGRWALIRMKGKGEKQPAWLLIKEKDPYARPVASYDVVEARPESVANTPPPKAVADATESPPAPTKQTASARGRKTGTRKAAARSSASSIARGSGKAKRTLPATAVKAPLPQRMKPELATLTDRAPDDSADWLYEIKFDGYRLLARIDDGKARVFTRNGHDWSAKLPAVVSALEALPLKSAWIDGEIVLTRADGVPDFQALQNAFDQSRTDAILYYAFDLVYVDGYDLRQTPLVERREVLEALFATVTAPNLRLSDVIAGRPEDVRASACTLGLEGIIGKRRASFYRSTRSGDWIKLKCDRGQEFVIGGYTEPGGSRPGIGALLLGVYDAAGKLQYAGKVGTGFDHAMLVQLKKQLGGLARKSRPFAGATDDDRAAHWVTPRLVAEVTFAEWTAEGRLRHPHFKGLRTDKSAKAIVREQPTSAKSETSAAPSAIALPSALKISHPDRVIDRASGSTKQDVVAYYAKVAKLMMEHLKGRPVSLVRAPSGVGGELFFQKHLDATRIAGITSLDPTLDPGHAPLLQIAKPTGLLGAAQFNTLEFHTWNGRSDRIDRPDRMTFDLDPGEGVSWRTVQEAARLVGEFLTELGLVSFLKTSGGAGLHLVVPLRRHYDWDTVKAFSKAIVQHLASTLPKRFSAKSGPRNRVGKVFIDYLRNGFGATTVAAWSLRSRAGLGVSVPLAWAELDRIEGSAQWTLTTIDARLQIGNAPWADYAKSSQSLGAAMQRLGFDADDI